MIPPARWLRAALAVPVLLPLWAGPMRASPTDDGFRTLGDEYLARWLQRAPHEATRLGLRTRDGNLLPVSRTTLAEDLTWLSGFRVRLAAVRADALSRDEAIEHALLTARVERQL